MQEATRVIVGIQVFAVGVELPKFYASRHWRSVGILLGPVMTFAWVLCAAFVMLIFDTDIATAMVVSACLTPTDPVLVSITMVKALAENDAALTISSFPGREYPIQQSIQPSCAKTYQRHAVRRIRMQRRHLVSLLVHRTVSIDAAHFRP